MPLVWLSLLTVLLTLTRANAQDRCFGPTIPTITTTRTAICAGTSTILRIQSGSLNDASNWKWYAGSCGGTPAGTGSSIQVSPNSTTTYYVRGEGGCVTPGACASQQITVSEPFFASLSNNGPLTCAKTSVTLTTNGGPSGATYTYSGGAQANSANPATATVSQSGPYSVTVAVAGGCSSIATTTVTSNTVASTVVVSPGNQTICSGQTATFTASGADTYTWSTGATTASTAASTPGSYSVTGSRASNGCSATATGQLTVLPTPTLSLDNARMSSSSRCDAPDGQIGFTTNVAGGDYSVSYRTSELSDVQTQTVTVADSRFVLSGLSGGSYYGFSLSSAGCTGTNSVTVTLTNPVPPSVSISPASQTICQGQTASFTAQGGAVYSWSTGATTASLSVSVSGAYSVTATASNGCSATATASLTVNPLPMVYAVTGGGAYCQSSNGVAIGLTNSQTGVSYQLLLNGNAVDSSVVGTGSAFTFRNQTQAGTYTVRATNPATSCQQLMSGSTSVTLTAQPTVSISNNGPLTCAQTSVILTASGTTGASYAFQGVNGPLASSGNTASVSDMGTYTVTASLNGCTSTATTTVSSNTIAPTVSISPSATAICQGQTAVLTASGADAYQWLGPQGFTSTDNPITVRAPGTYSVTGTRSDNGCVATATASLTVNNPPTPSLTTQSGQPYPGNQSTVTVPQYSGSVVLEAKGSPGGSLQWTGPNGTTGTGNISVPTTNTGTFVYQLSCQLNSCTSVPASATVIVEAGALMMFTPVYDCSTRLLSLRTAGGNGQPIEYQIPSVTTDWGSSSTFILQAKHLGKSLKLRARQRSTTSGGYVEVETSFTPTACGARQATESVETPLQVVVLSNPVMGSEAQVEIRGAEGQVVNVRLVDLQGRTVHEQRIEQAGETKLVSLPLGQSRGLLLLNVSTTSQQQRLKLVRP